MHSGAKGARMLSCAGRCVGVTGVKETFDPRIPEYVGGAPRRGWQVASGKWPLKPSVGFTTQLDCRYNLYARSFLGDKTRLNSTFAGG